MSIDNVLIAKQKMKSLTTIVEKSLYELRYKNSEYNMLNENLYNRLKILCNDSTCNEKGLTFPLIRKDGNIYLNSTNEDLFTVLHILADNYEIILDYKQIF